MPITYLRGDATHPAGEGKRLIVHICNDMGAWGRGFVMALSARWDEPERAYREWHRSGYTLYDHHQEEFKLGNIQLVSVQNSRATLGLWVVNMIAQHGIGVKDGVPPIRYDALRECLTKVAGHCNGGRISMPRIGCGLAGGTWEKVGPIVEETVGHLDVFVFDF
jgi:O-acetyl-ADP-ribose deacetylase (regulator of RNase III)